MRVAFLASAQHDLKWFRRYYERTFPEGAGGARVHYRRALANLKDNPKIGRPTETPEIRALPVPRTPFSLIYRIARDRIEIIHVLDGRADH